MEVSKLLPIVNSALKSKEGIKSLKTLAVKLKHYEEASWIREVEKASFPETEELMDAKRKVHQLSIFFRLMDINAGEHAIFCISEALELYATKKGDLNVNDAAKIKEKANEFFPE